MNANGDPNPAGIGDLDLQAFVDGVLKDDRRNELLAHLASHPHEAERANAFFRQKALLAELREQLTLEDQADPIAPDLTRGLVRAVRRQRLFQHVRQVAAAMVVVLPAVAVGWAIYLLEREPVLEQHSELMPTELMAPEFPFGAKLALLPPEELTNDGTASLAFLAQHLTDQQLRVPDLGTIGLQLIGGDPLPDAPTPAARLVYADTNGHQLMVYVGVASSEIDQAMAFAPEGTISLHLRRGPLVLAIVGPTDSQLILDVARLVSEEITQVASMPAPVGEKLTSATNSVIQPVALPGGADLASEVTPLKGDGPALVPEGVRPGTMAPLQNGVPSADDSPKVL